MNREIKFRVWDEKFNCWDKGGFYIYANELIQKQGYIIQQYTGLKDKNGKEIYEGDVLKEHHFEDWGDKEGFDYFGVVRYKTYPNDSMGLQLAGYVTYPNAEENKNYGGNRILLNCEVVGNIFENRELLS